MSREKRYSFFTKVYKKYNCEKLLIAHNMDDFLETAIFNYKTKRNTKFYGIKKRNNLFGMNIYRPLLFSYFKKTITKKCLNKGIPFHFDYTNNEPKYSRNEIRIENNKKSKFWKIYLFIYFNFLNFLNCFNLYIINKNYKKWELFNFSQDEFEFLKKKENLIYLFINNNYDDIRLSKNKINSIQDFILSKNRTQKYKLSNNKYLFKKRGCLVQKEKNTL
ncbi:tRNA lysidine(34) synthetase TilS [Mycoplasmopsis cynos]|nr:tRNA lysidine(34) synthetase TilS [Mycoplasmopsis cynos]